MSWLLSLTVLGTICKTSRYSIAPLEKNKARISYSVKYRFNNEDSVKIQQFTYNNAEIEKEDGSYKIKAIGKTGTEPDWERTLEE